MGKDWVFIATYCVETESLSPPFQSSQILFLMQTCTCSNKPHCKQFSIYVFPQKIWPSPLQLTTKYFQHNVLSEITAFSRKKSTAVSIGNNIFSNGIMKLQQQRRFIFKDQHYKRWPLEFIISFSKIDVWDFGIEVWLISFGILQSKSQLD